jgi:predicted GNAT family acetyltransferase
LTDRAGSDALLLRLAEAPNAYEPLGADEQLIVRDSFILFLGRGDHAGANSVQYLRLAPKAIPAIVSEVRTLARMHGRRAITWEVTTSATPHDLATQLQLLGMTPATPPKAVVMALHEPPSPAPTGITVTRVATIADFRTFVSITHEVFGVLDRLENELIRIDHDGAADLADIRFRRYLAWSEGSAIAAASATFTEHGVMLHAGSTTARYRGRGAYRALVAARWQEALDYGTPLLVTRAGPQSRPILQRLGFSELAEISFLVDQLG